MALGSLVTVAVLVAAIVFIPRFMRARAGGQTTAQTTQSSEITPAPAPAPSPTPEAPTPTPAATADVQPTPTPTLTPTVTPAPMPVIPATPPRHREHLAAAPPPPPQQQQQQSAPPAETHANQAAVAEVHETYDQLSIRVTSVHTGLQSLQNQMGGMGLRADMREAATRMDALIQKADRQIQAGDIDAATKTLENADRVTSQLEKFLGQ